MGEDEGWGSPPPTNAPFYMEKDHLRHFDNSINAVSFGFLATAILISMFLIMAIFERFIRPISPDSTPTTGRRRYPHDIESQSGFAGKLFYTSPKVSVHAKEISVMMPGQNLPTFIAYPAPIPCPPNRITWPPNPTYASPNRVHRTNPNVSPISTRRPQASSSENEIITLHP